MKIINLLIIILCLNLASMSQNSDILYASANTININDGDKTTKNTQSFEVSANPVEEIITLKFNVSSNIESIKMIDNNSNIIFETGKTRGAAGSTINIPVEDMEPGTYFIRVQNDNGTQIQRIIISH